MVNQRFYKNLGPHKLSSIIEFLGNDIEWSMSADHQDLDIYDIKILQEASFRDISFLSNPAYTKFLNNTNAAAVIVPQDIAVEGNNALLLRAQNPYFAYSRLIEFFYSSIQSYPVQISPSACVAHSASIGQNCYIGHHAVIEDDAIIGDDSVIGAGSFVGRGVIIGRGASIGSAVSVSYSVIGDNVVISSGARIGQDGFGFSTENGVHHRIFHTGIVKIGNNVRIGANTTIDRGALTDTVIDDLCKIDNLVQIGHGAKIGKGSIIAAHVGIAGSATIGRYCILGGQVGVAGHLNVGDGVQAAGQSGIINDIAPGVVVGGTPALPIKEWHKQSVIMKQLLKKETK